MAAFTSVFQFFFRKKAAQGLVGCISPIGKVHLLALSRLVGDGTKVFARPLPSFTTMRFELAPPYLWGVKMHQNGAIFARSNFMNI